MEKIHITFSNQQQLRRIISMLLTVTIVLLLFPANAYAYDYSTVENCTSNVTITDMSENEPLLCKKGTEALSFAGGCGTESDPYRIATAEQLDQVRYYLDKNFVLTEDIDLSEYKNWQPIGTFQAVSEDEPETPVMDLAFTGNFDGNGHTISNMTINQPDGIASGLFGCTAGKLENSGSIHNLTVENVNVTGDFLAGGIVAYQSRNCTLNNVSLIGSNEIRGNFGIGGITGAGKSDLKDCDAVANIVVLDDNGYCAGILVGGTEAVSLINCTATGTIVAEGNNCFGLGGLAGGPAVGIAVTNCHSNGVSITATGKNNTMVGGLLGFTGTYGEDPKTPVKGCSANATIIVSNSTERVGGLVGGSFYHESYAEEKPVPSSYAISSCITSGSITGCRNEVGSIAGYAYNSIVKNCTSNMTINCASDVLQVGKEETGVLPPTTGILVVAHGSPEDEWNQPVRNAVEGIDCPYPVELGFLEYVEGEDIGTAVANLEKQGVEHIITVPIFVASASDHIEEIKYMLGLPSSIKEKEATEAGLKVISHNAEIEITPALDDHQLVAEILDDRISTVSQQADKEIVVLAAHGTSEAADLAVWKKNLASLGQQLKENYKFLNVDYGFVALGEPNIRTVVEAKQKENPGASIIVMPVMLSEGTFTGTKIPEVLDGLTYLYPAEGQRSLLPHDDISNLIVARAYDAMGIFAGGNGTKESPYQIATAEQLDQVRYYLDKDFVLTADIDLSGYKNWTPIGTIDENIFYNGGHSDIAFSGTFDGNGHTVSNLTATHQDLVGVGLFGVASSDAVIKNLTVENASVNGYMSTAGIIGLNCASVKNLVLKGENTISGVNCIGGIIGGHGFESVKNCTVEDVTINVQGDNDFSSGPIIQCDMAECGGLIIGGAFTGSIENCSARGEIIAEGNEPVGLGGIGGCLEYMENITGCTADVTITAPNSAHAVGGLCGYAGTGDAENPAVIENCSVKFVMNTANATHIGGLVGTGLYYMGMETVFSINNCSTEGQINGAITPGAIAGRAENCVIGSEINCTVKSDGNSLLAKIGTTERMYESSDQPEGFEDLSTWANSGSGSFESIVNYVNDEALNDVWNTAASSEMAQMMAGMFGVNVTDGASLKAMFANMASAPANNGTQIYQIKFGYDYKTIYFCDQNGNVIESHPYTFVESNNSLGMLAGETTYVFKADDNAGVLTYIAMLKPHFDEGMDETTMPAHIHLYYAETKDMLSTYKPDSVTLSSWMPTMLQTGDEFSTADKVAMLECLFGIDEAFAGGSGMASDPYQVATAEQLNKVRNYLDKDFVLTADIDLSGYKNWEPIGAFKPLSDKPEDEETPDPEVAFTGTFDGNGHTICNVAINQPEGMSVGLFGCIVGKQDNPCSISNLKVKCANVTGNFCVGDVVGFQYGNCILENITLTGNNTAQGNIYVGGILGGSDMGNDSSELKDCNAAADIVVLGYSGNSAGVLGGALNACSVINCTATGTVTGEGDEYFALGGLIGGVFEGVAVINCHADNVSITASGENDTMIGGLLGYAGTYDEDAPTQIAECSTNVTMKVSDSTERVGGLIGGSFYHDLYADARPIPASYAISGCATSGSIIGSGNEVGSIAGYAYNSTVKNCTSTMIINCVSDHVPQVGLYESAFADGNETESDS